MTDTDTDRDLLAELRSTFLLEGLDDEQLAFVAAHGVEVAFDAGVRVFSEGEPAEHFYVLLDGAVQLLRRVGRDEVVVTETSQRGVYAGATRAFVPSATEQGYMNSLRTTVPSRFFRLDGSAFAELMQRWFPLAVHLLDGLYLGVRSSEATVRQREKLASLGALSAGLAHELNNPAAAGTRAAHQLRGRIAAMRHKLAKLADGRLDGRALAQLVDLQEEAVERLAKAPERSALEAADAEDAVSDWLDAHGVADSWELAPVFVGAGLDVDFLDKVGATLDADFLEGALRWLAYTVETEGLMNEIADATSRISTLVAAVKQYTHMDRAPFQEVDLHAGLDSTVVMLGAKLSGITVVRDYADDLPAVPGYGGELNQVWTNLIANAAEAMDGAGTLTLRTARDGDAVVVEVIDDGPGIPEEVADRVFDAFFTTKPVGVGSGLGLDISKRIVETRHAGRLEFDSRPGRTVFRVRLPSDAAAAAAASAEG